MDRYRHQQPALLARWPEPLRTALRAFGIAVRTLALQDAGPDPIPLVSSPLLIDLRGYTLVQTARLICALRARQRHTGIVPHLLVAPGMVGAQHLIAACSDMRAIVLDAEQPEAICTWLCAPAKLIPGQVWVNVSKPTALTHQRFPPMLPNLIVALDQSASIEETAVQCALSPKSIYALLHKCCEISDDCRRSLWRWQRLLSLALTGDNDHSAQQSLECARNEVGDDSSSLAQLIQGALVAHWQSCQGHNQITCEALTVPHATLIVEGASSLLPELDSLAPWARVVEWADRLPNHELLVGLSCGEGIYLRNVSWYLRPRTRHN